jgi:glycosyltransferase involved in cell wall biosynthesis
MAESTTFAFPAVSGRTTSPRAASPPNDENRPLPLNIVMAIHTSPDDKTAVYKATLRRATYLETQGHTCRIVTPHDFPFLRRVSPRFLPLVYPIVLAVWLARQKSLDLALFHSYAGWATSLAQKLLRVMRSLRTAIVFHGLEPLYYARLEEQAALAEMQLSWRYRVLHGVIMQKLLRLSTRQTNAVFCLNREEQRFLIDHQWTPRERVKVLANATPEHFFLSPRRRNHASLLLFVGQWLPMKGTEYLVEAFTSLRRENPRLQLCCAGTMVSESDVLADFPAELRESVSVFPRVTESELLALHREADIFVFPSLSEGFSLALAEAMASGLPIVATNLGAAPDLLVHEESALLVPPHAGGPLTYAISRLLHDAALRTRLGDRAQSAAEQLRPNAVMKDFEVCIQLLVPKRNSGDNGLQRPVLANEGI